MDGIATPEQAARTLSRSEQRTMQREESSRLAREAAYARSQRGKETLVERVEKAKAVLAGKNVAGAIQHIQSVPSRDYDVYLIAEKTGQARRGVLQQFGAPRGTVERAYLDEVGGAGLGNPDEKE